MIPWHLFTSPRRPTYSDLVYAPTPNIISRLEYYPYHTQYLNTPPLDNADERRFAISQLPPAHRQAYLLSFQADHISKVQNAIDVLEGHIAKHEEAPLSSFDRLGRPPRRDTGAGGGCASGTASRRNGGGSPRERMQRLSRGNARKHRQSSREIRRRPDRYALEEDSQSSSSSSSDCGFDIEEIYDFSSSLPGLEIDRTNDLFSDLSVLEQALSTDCDLSLSPTPSHIEIQSCKRTTLLPLNELAQLSSSPTLRQPTPPPPPLTTADTAITMTTTASSTAPIKANLQSCSIANLIHPPLPDSTTSPSQTNLMHPLQPITVSSNPSCSSEPDISTLLSTLPATSGPRMNMSNQTLGLQSRKTWRAVESSSSSQPQTQPHSYSLHSQPTNLDLASNAGRIPTSDPTSDPKSPSHPNVVHLTDSLHLLRQEIRHPAVPLKANRTMKFPRMRRNSVGARRGQGMEGVDVSGKMGGGNGAQETKGSGLNRRGVGVDYSVDASGSGDRSDVQRRNDVYGGSGIDTDFGYADATERASGHRRHELPEHPSTHDRFRVSPYYYAQARQQEHENEEDHGRRSVPADADDRETKAKSYDKIHTTIDVSSPQVAKKVTFKCVEPPYIDVDNDDDDDGKYDIDNIRSERDRCPDTGSDTGKGLHSTIGKDTLKRKRSHHDSSSDNERNDTRDELEEEYLTSRTGEVSPQRRDRDREERYCRPRISMNL